MNTNRLIDDPKIDQIEHLVAKSYGTTVHELNLFYKDTDAKLMCCFLMYDVLGYSIKMLANWYRIYPKFLENKINEYYIKCLHDSDFKASVQGFRVAVQFKDLQPAT